MIPDHNRASFGALLQSLRKQRNLTQQAVANALGIHRRTLGRWEQGDYLPESKALILELVHYLKLDDQEARQLLEASLTALSPYWSVPLPRNPYFTGREETLEALHTQLGVEHAVTLTQSSALHGLGGVGKTQLALEYAYRHALDYSAVFWVMAEKEEHIQASLRRIAETLQLPERSEKDESRMLTAVRHWLALHREWLLIWDNVEDLEMIQRFLPPLRQGAILITTRCQTLGTLTRGLELLPMPPEEGVLFLFRRAKVLEPSAGSDQLKLLAERLPAQYATATAVAETLGGLPLALDQAGAYLEATHYGLSAYLNVFRARRAALLRQRGWGAHEHPASVSTTLTLAIRATARQHPAVLDLLRVCALVHPDAIPEELFRQGAESLGPELEAACHDPLAWDQMVQVACSYSLLARQSESQMLSLHRLVQAVLLDEMMAEQEWERWEGRVIAALDRVFPQVLGERRCLALETG